MAPDASAPAVQVRDLRRSFAVRGHPDRVALDGVDLELGSGGVHGLLGPNGAGKTTLCRILATALLPSAGTARVLGYDVVADPRSVRRRIGLVLGGDRGLYGRLTAEENLRFWGAVHGLPRPVARRRAAELLGRLGLADRAGSRVETFSRGMRQRLHLARGLVPDPPLLLLDEPTSGMDPVAAHDFRDLVRELRAEGRTVLLTTHDMAEADAVCDTLTFVDGGRVLGSGTPLEVRARLGDAHHVRVEGVDAAAAAILRARLGETVPSAAVRPGSDGVLEVAVPVGDVAAVVGVALAAGHLELATSPPSLEDVYLGLLGPRARAGADAR